jgi:chromosome partitioning protein
MPTVAAGQHKGGVGKTSMILNLACQAVAKRKRVVVVDLDANQTATEWGRRRQENDKLAPIPIVRPEPREAAKEIDHLKSGGLFDWVFLDLPGHEGAMLSVGLTKADLTLIPCRPFEDDVRPSMRTVGLLRNAGRPYAFVMNIASKSRASAVVKDLRQDGHAVAPAIIPARFGVPDANAQGMGINETEPGSEADKQFAALFKWLKDQFK